MSAQDEPTRSRPMPAGGDDRLLAVVDPATGRRM